VLPAARNHLREPGPSTSAVRRLPEGLKALREAGRVAKGKLATVQSMTHGPS
jgi:hypothetical protein